MANNIVIILYPIYKVILLPKTTSILVLFDCNWKRHRIIYLNTVYVGGGIVVVFIEFTNDIFSISANRKLQPNLFIGMRMNVSFSQSEQIKFGFCVFVSGNSSVYQYDHVMPVFTCFYLHQMV